MFFDGPYDEPPEFYNPPEDAPAVTVCGNCNHNWELHSYEGCAVPGCGCHKANPKERQ